MSKHSITRSRRGSPLPAFRGGQRGCGRYDFLGEHTLRYYSTDPNRGLWGKVDGDAVGMAHLIDDQGVMECDRVVREPRTCEFERKKPLSRSVT